VLAGVLVFGDVPDGLTLIGMVIVAGGGILVALPDRERRR
jgi:drug/metabolite transporter (DMT)-like permease